MPATLTTLQDLIDQWHGGLGPPQGTDSAAELDDYIRQLQGFLVNFLNVSFNATDGTLKSSAITSATFTGGTIPGSAITGDIDGGKLTANSVGYAQLTKWDNGDGTAAVRENTIDSDAVVRRHIKDGEVVAGKLGAGAINAASLFATGVVDSNALAASSVTNAKVSDVSGVKLTANTVPATSLAVGPLTGTEIGLPVVVAPSSAASQIAKIGGALSATLNSATNTLVFALAAGVASEGTIYSWKNANSGTATTGSLQNVTGWTAKVDGDEVIDWSVADARFNITEPGVYIVFFELSAYSVESFRAVLSVNGTEKISGNDVFLPLGAGGTSHGFGIIEFTGATGYFTIGYHCGRTQATNGLGYSTLATPVFGRVLLLAVA